MVQNTLNTFQRLEENMLSLSFSVLIDKVSPKALFSGSCELMEALAIGLGLSWKKYCQ